MNTDLQWMQAAVELAKEAGQAGEVPVGAVVVRDGILVGRGRNGPVGTTDPTAHAEIMALRDAAKTIGNYRLENCTMYVTLEPCIMCAGALVWSKLDRIVFAASDTHRGYQKAGISLHPKTTSHGGVLEYEAKALLDAFFAKKRA